MQTRLLSLRVSRKSKKQTQNEKAASAYTFIWDPKINNVRDKESNVFHIQRLFDVAGRRKTQYPTTARAGFYPVDERREAAPHFM